MLTVQVLFRNLFLLALAPACFSQSKISLTGVVEMDGRPCKNARLYIVSSAKHMVSEDWIVPIIGSKTVGVIGSTGNPSHEQVDWARLTKTDKLGHFRVTVPAGAYVDIYLAVGPIPMFKGGDAAVRASNQRPCAEYHKIVPDYPELRLNLNSRRTASQGGCLVNGQ